MVPDVVTGNGRITTSEKGQVACAGRGASGGRQSVTLIVIAHKLSTVRLADHIAVMENGVVTTSGTFTEVSEKSSWFCQSYDDPGKVAAAAGNS